MKHADAWHQFFFFCWQDITIYVGYTQLGYTILLVRYDLLIHLRLESSPCSISLSLCAFLCVSTDFKRNHHQHQLDRQCRDFLLLLLLLLTTIATPKTIMFIGYIILYLAELKPTFFEVLGAHPWGVGPLWPPWLLGMLSHARKINHWLILINQ